jgi:hypothetical protein
MRSPIRFSAANAETWSEGGNELEGPAAARLRSKTFDKRSGISNITSPLAAHTVDDLPLGLRELGVARHIEARDISQAIPRSPSRLACPCSTLSLIPRRATCRFWRSFYTRLCSWEG